MSGGLDVSLETLRGIFGGVGDAKARHCYELVRFIDDYKVVRFRKSAQDAASALVLLPT
jgi:hypothetical protein